MHKNPIRPHLTANNLLVWPVAAALRHVGADVSTVLAQVGLDEDTAFSPDGRVPLDRIFAIWRVAVELTGDAALGVRLAAIHDPLSTVSWPMPLSLFEHMGMFCSSLVDAVALTNRYLRLLRDGIRTEVDLDGKRAVFRIELLPDQPSAMVEYDFAIAVNTVRRIAKRGLPLDEVWFTHEAPPAIERHVELFKAPLRFGAPFNAVVCQAEDFTRPLPRANPGMCAHLVRRAESLLAALPTLDIFEDKVCAQIRIELSAGNTNASVIAEKLGVSARTLHRRLQKEGTSYQELLDTVRLRLSVGYLETGKSISQVALLVGFAQASTFHRAFKSWTGETPADYQLRKNALQGARFELDEAVAKAAGIARRAG